MKSEIVAYIQETLSEERVALMSGEFEKLAKFTAKKVKILTKLPRQGLSMAELKEISAGFLRNQSMMESAIAGVQFAQKQVFNNGVLSEKSRVYDQCGAMQYHGEAVRESSFKL